MDCSLDSEHIVNNAKAIAIPWFSLKTTKLKKCKYMY